MSKKRANRMWLANKLYKWFPKKFCWADLAMWGLRYKPFFSIFKLFGKPYGCVIDSMEKMLCKGSNENCYCGCWINGHHQSTMEGKRIVEKIREQYKTTEQEITEELPF